MIRRGVLIWLTVTLLSLAAVPVASALDRPAARDHVEQTLDAILELIVANLDRDQTADVLRDIIVERTASTHLARFVTGRAWNGMSDAERTRFTAVFTTYIAHVYAGHFRRFDGEVEDLRKYVGIVDVQDVGRKGLLVRAEIRPLESLPISIDWLVSDRSGRVAISDLVVEGISVSLTQRDIIGAMIDARDGDVSRLIDDLAKKIAEPGT